MIVVSDTSPITALLAVKQERLLRLLFREVVIPRAVREELMRWHQSIPDWLRVADVRNEAEALRLAQIVDQGEAEAIELAKELGADRLLIDERKGRRLAMDEGVRVLSLVGLALLAKKKGLIISARDFLRQLETEAGVFLAAKIRERALQSVGE